MRRSITSAVRTIIIGSRDQSRRVNVWSNGRLSLAGMVTRTELAGYVDRLKNYGVMNGAPGRRALVSQALQISEFVEFYS